MQYFISNIDNWESDIKPRQKDFSVEENLREMIPALFTTISDYGCSSCEESKKQLAHKVYEAVNSLANYADIDGYSMFHYSNPPMNDLSWLHVTKVDSVCAVGCTVG